MTAPAQSMIRDERGVTVIEFALIAPVLLIGLLGLFDLGHNMYTATMLQGAIQKAARDATIEGADDDVIDDKIEAAVRIIAPNAVATFTRKSYTNFSDVGRAEEHTEGNGNSVCDAGEPFEDANGNGTWDADRGQAGGGGARDAVLYEVSVTYDRPFPVAKFLGQATDYTLVAKTVLRNQPFSVQDKSMTIGTCT